MIQRLRVAATKRAKEKADETRTKGEEHDSKQVTGTTDEMKDDNEESDDAALEKKLYGHSAEARMQMHRDMELKRKRKADLDSGKGTPFEKPKDMVKEAYAKVLTLMFSTLCYCKPSKLGCSFPTPSL
jgi:hypothetical protein